MNSLKRGYITVVSGGYYQYGESYSYFVAVYGYVGKQQQNTL